VDWRAKRGEGGGVEKGKGWLSGRNGPRNWLLDLARLIGGRERSENDPEPREIVGPREGTLALTWERGAFGLVEKGGVANISWGGKKNAQRVGTFLSECAEKERNGRMRKEKWCSTKKCSKGALAYRRWGKKVVRGLCTETRREHQTGALFWEG